MPKTNKQKFNWQLWKYFVTFLGIGFFLLLYTCFLERYVTVPKLKCLLWSIDRDIVISILSQFSGTFFVLAILVITVERVFRTFLKEDVDSYNHKIAQSVHDAVFKNFIPSEIHSEVKQQILLSAFVYRNYSVEYIAQEIEKIDGEECIRFSSEMTHSVHNISEITRTFKGTLEYTNPEFEERPAPVKHEKLEIKHKNVTKVLYDEAKCKQLVEEKSGDKDEIILPYEVEIPGGDKVEVRVYRTLYLKADKDEINFFIMRPTVNLNVKIEFPSADYILRYYPSTPELKNKFKKDVRHQNKEFDIHYSGGLLPYQGVIIDWERKR